MKQNLTSENKTVTSQPVLRQVFDLTFGHVADGIFYADSGFLAGELGIGAPAIHVVYVRPSKPWGRPRAGAPHTPSSATSTGWGCDAAGHWYQLRWRPNQPVRARTIAGPPWPHIPPLNEADARRLQRGHRTWGRFNRMADDAKKKLQDARVAYLMARCPLL